MNNAHLACAIRSFKKKNHVFSTYRMMNRSFHVKSYDQQNLIYKKLIEENKYKHFFVKKECSRQIWVFINLINYVILDLKRIIK